MKKLELKIIGISFIIIVVFVTCISCRQEICKGKINNLIQRLDKERIKDFYGFSAQSIGKDKDNKAFIARIFYIIEPGNSVAIPSFQERKYRSIEARLKHQRDYEVDYKRICAILKIPTRNYKEVVKEKSSEIAELFHKYDLYEIRSSRHSGDFIEFVFDPGCSVWYLSDDWSEKNNYSAIVKNAIVLGNNWFILDEPYTKKQRESYK